MFNRDNTVLSRKNFGEFLNRYNFYPKLDKAWTFGEEDNTPLRLVFKKVPNFDLP